MNATNEGWSIKVVQSPPSLGGRGWALVGNTDRGEPQSVLSSGLLMAEKNQFPAANL